MARSVLPTARARLASRRRTPGPRRRHARSAKLRTWRRRRLPAGGARLTSRRCIRHRVSRSPSHCRSCLLDYRLGVHGAHALHDRARLAAASSQRTTASTAIGRSNQPDQPGGDEHGHQPVCALGDADVGRVPEALGSGLGVGDDRAQAPSRPGRAPSAAGCRLRRRTTEPTREDRSVARPGRASSRGTPPTSQSWPRAGP